MKRLSWKYIAGFIDGEGCIDFQCHVDKRNKHQRLYIVPRLRIAMAESALFILDNLKTNHGGNMWEAKRKNKSDKWQNAYYWQIQGKIMRPFLQNIVNHLILKKEQAKFAIWWVDNGMGMHPYHDKESYDLLGVIRQSARDEIKAMKIDPQRLSERAIQKISELMR